MKLIGVTGGISCGKTTITQFLREYGEIYSDQYHVVIIDSDEIAHSIYSPQSKCYKTVKSFFDNYLDVETNRKVDIFNDDGKTIDRAKLSAAVFKDVKVRKMINQATHMEIFKEIMFRISKEFFKSLTRIGKETLCFVELPLLFETKVFKYIVSTIVCIKTSDERQLQWLMNRNGYSQEEALQRIKSQLPVEEKAKRSHFVIDNCKDKTYLKEETFKVVDQCAKHASTFGLKFFLITIGIIICGFILKFIFN